MVVIDWNLTSETAVTSGLNPTQSIDPASGCIRRSESYLEHLDVRLLPLLNISAYDLSLDLSVRDYILDPCIVHHYCRHCFLVDTNNLDRVRSWRSISGYCGVPIVESENASLAYFHHDTHLVRTGVRGVGKGRISNGCGGVLIIAAGKLEPAPMLIQEVRTILAPVDRKSKSWILLRACEKRAKR